MAAELVAKLKKMISLIMEAYELELRLLKQGGGGSNDLCGSGIQGNKGGSATATLLVMVGNSTVLYDE